MSVSAVSFHTYRIKEEKEGAKEEMEVLGGIVSGEEGGKE